MNKPGFGGAKSHANQQGSILILILLLISILVVLVLEGMHQMQVEAASSKIFTANVQGRSLNRSGLLFARHILAADKALDLEEENLSDHYGEFWSGFLDQDTLQGPVFTTGGLKGTIQDEQAKFPVNFLVDDQGKYRNAHKEVFIRLLENAPFGLKPEKIQELLSALKDWLDADDSPEGELGAEQAYYSFQGKHSTCRNGPLASLAELRLVKGFDQDLLQGGKDRPGLIQLLTVHSSGRVNINTAPAMLLAALVQPGITRETADSFAQAMLTYRRDPDHFDFLHEKDWYRNRMAGFNDIQLPAGLIATSSDFFSTRLTARVGGIQVLAYAVHKRESAADVVNVHLEVR
jgi:general secretion pathway protein K